MSSSASIFAIASPLAFALTPPKSSPSDDTRPVVVDTGRGEHLDEQRRLDARTPGFASAIDLDEPAGARPSDGLAEVLTRSAGVTVRSVGGLGQFSAVSLRGSTAQQVAVFLDGVPLGDSVGGLVDVADLPLDGLGRVEVYRGHVPVAFGSAAIGGALNLVSVDPGNEKVVSGAAGFGSFLSRQAAVSFRGPVGATSELTAHAAYAGSKGNFPFFDDGGTPRTPGDDTTTTRTNNGYDRMLGQLAFGVRRGVWRIRGQQWLLWKSQGIPGTGAVQAEEAALDTLTMRTTLSLAGTALSRDRSDLEWIASLGAIRRRFMDLENEVGSFIDDELTWSLDVYVSPRLRLPLWQDASLALVGEHRTEWVRIDERAETPAESSGDSIRRRHGFGFGLELEQWLLRRHWLLAPSLRVDTIDSRFAVPPGEGALSDDGRNTLHVGYAPRFGTRISIVPGLELRASAGRYFRPPTSSELFGDRGYIIGNEGLTPERGTSVDGGLVIDWPDLRRLSVYGHGAAFVTWAEDLVQWVQAGPVTRSENVAGARLWGLESSCALDAFSGLAKLQGNYTFLVTENRSGEPEQRGNSLPGRPKHELFGRASTGYEFRPRDVHIEPRFFYTVEFIGGTFLDPSERRKIPARTIHGLGAELHLVRQVHLALEIRNLLDLRTTTWSPPIEGESAIRVPLSDFIGFPLPGRSVWATLRFDLYLARKHDRSSHGRGSEPT